MHSFYLCLATAIILWRPTVAQQLKAPPDTIATHYQLPGSDCALFPATAALPRNFKDFNVTANGRFTPNREQVAAVEKLLPQVDFASVQAYAVSSYYAGYPAIIHKNLRKYQRQYFGFYSIEKHACLYINFFIESFEEPPGAVPSWLRHPIETYDGGAAFWSIYYDLTTRRFFRFSHNLEG